MDRTLTVHRRAPEGYLIVLTGELGQRLRAGPFEAVELVVSELFDDAPPAP